MFNGKFVPLQPLSEQTSTGEMVEWSITTVLKTVVLRGTGGSNPSLSATIRKKRNTQRAFLFLCVYANLPNFTILPQYIAINPPFLFISPPYIKIKKVILQAETQNYNLNNKRK